MKMWGRVSEWVSVRWSELAHCISKSTICSIYESFHLGFSFRYHYLITILCHNCPKKKKKQPSTASPIWAFSKCLTQFWLTNKRSTSVTKSNSTWIMQRNVFLISELLRVCKIKWRAEVLKVNQQRLGPAWLCRQLRHRKLRPKCKVVKVTAHLCLVKTFQGVVKRHVCSRVAAPQQGSFSVWPWNCL